MLLKERRCQAPVKNRRLANGLLPAYADFERRNFGRLPPSGPHEEKDKGPDRHKLKMCSQECGFE
jgi:hypothetical protein